MSLPSNSGSTAFIRLRQEGRAEEVVRRMIEAIELGLFIEGEQLPSEAELAAQLGVATVTLREALAILRQRGLITTRRGRNGGSFIGALQEAPPGSLHAQLSGLGSLELRDLADEHAAIAGATARLAARRAAPEHHQRLQQQIDSLLNADNRLCRRRADARFHIEIAVAAQSMRLTRAETRLQAELGELLWLELESAEAIAGVAREHQAILDAIIDGDSNLASALAEAHVHSGIRRLTQLRLQQLAVAPACIAENPH